MASEAVKKHPWHMVPPSPWPAVGTLGVFGMALGGVWYMHGGARLGASLLGLPLFFTACSVGGVMLLRKGR